MIKLISPHYINIPFVSPALGFTCKRYLLEVFVWSGLKSSPPAEPNYSITKENPTASTETDKINISRITKDFINFTPIENGSTDLVDTDNQVWIKTQVYYSDENGTVVSVPEIQQTEIAVRGYGYGMSGENPLTPSNKILIDVNDYYRVKTDGMFVVPIETVETTPPAPSIVIDDIVEILAPNYNLEFTAVGTYASFYITITPDGLDPFIEPLAGTTSPQAIVLNYTGDVDVQMFGYDSASNQDIESNIFELTIV